MQLKPLFSSDLPALARRVIDTHKSAAGSLCIVAGSYGMAGAAALCASGALRSGAGYVRVVCPKSIYPILATLVPSAVFVPLDDSEGGYSAKDVERVRETMKVSSAIAVGPGLSGSAAGSLLEEILADCGIPVVLDAGAFDFITDIPVARGAMQSGLIITPHPGEAARLLGVSAGEIQADRKAAVEELAARYGAVAVLKGALTLVCDGKCLYENTTGNAGMAKAGTGDVLTGVIGALAAGGVGPFDAGCLGVYLHGRAGDIAGMAKGRGLLAEDITEAIPEAFLEYEGGTFERGGV